jgi:hypothetical protein
MNTIPSSLSKEEILKKHLGWISPKKVDPEPWQDVPLTEELWDAISENISDAFEEYAQQLQPPGTSDAITKVLNELENEIMHNQAKWNNFLIASFREFKAKHLGNGTQT